MLLTLDNVFERLVSVHLKKAKSFQIRNIQLPKKLATEYLLVLILRQTLAVLLYNLSSP